MSLHTGSGETTTSSYVSFPTSSYGTLRKGVKRRKHDDDLGQRQQRFSSSHARGNCYRLGNFALLCAAFAGLLYIVVGKTSGTGSRLSPASSGSDDDDYTVNLAACSDYVSFRIPDPAYAMRSLSTRSACLFTGRRQ